MSESYYEFDNRLKRIGKSRGRLANGYVSVVGDDGLIVVKPRRARGKFPLRGALMLIVGFIGFKAAILATLGAPVYQDRVDSLSAGSAIEQGGAWVMQADPLTVLVADQIRPYLR